MRAMLGFFVAASLVGGAALAAEPSGCDKFKWPIDKVQAALATPGTGPLAAGAVVPAGAAARLTLVPFAEAKLALAPERPPKFSPSYAGAFALDAPAAATVVKVTLSTGGWVDIVQGGKFLKPIAFSAATDCPNVRKMLKFRVAAGPATLQLTGVAAPETAVLVSIEPAP